MLTLGLLIVSLAYLIKRASAVEWVNIRHDWIEVTYTLGWLLIAIGSLLNLVHVRY